MNNRRYQKTVTMHRPEGLMLEVDVISLLYPTEQVLYSVPLARLAATEIRLEEGRFDLFSHDTQENRIGDGYQNYTGTLSENFLERLTWIAANATDRWSFDLTMGSVHEASLAWSFRSLDNALMFKLSF